MNEFRFTLKPYKTPADRIECPHCHQKRCFVPYIDTEGKIIFPHDVGRCNHENSCGYHYTPKQYFHDHPDSKEGLKDTERWNSRSTTSGSCRSTSKPQSAQKTTSPKPETEAYYFPLDLMLRTENHYEHNHLFLFLKSRFGYENTLSLMHTYHVGTSKHWDGATVFWQVDRDGRVRDGKIMYYDAATGHRAQDIEHHVTWLHTLQRIDKNRIRQCFFGEHLLGNTGNKNKPVAIVESEKSALIASVYIPQYVWIASGGKDGMFNQANLDIFKGRTVILFPDLGQDENWLHKAAFLKSQGINIVYYRYLEEHASPKERAAGWDIADFLILEDPRKAILRNPVIGLLVEKLRLEIV